MDHGGLAQPRKTLTVLVAILAHTKFVNGYSPERVPLPDIARVMDISSCTSSTGKSPCGQSNSLKLRNASIGDSCDPYLWRFAKRKFDDSRSKNWLRQIGRSFNSNANDNEFSYQGQCQFLCPEHLCISVFEKNEKKYVDLITLDCVTIDVRRPNEGVCTCGSFMSQIDPLSGGIQKVLGGNRLLKYNGTKGLDRRLIWDQSRGTCSAAEYGHCSYHWDGDFQVGDETFCWDPDLRCVNRSVTHFGVVHQPMEVKSALFGRSFWYGVCASVDRLGDPFSSDMSTATCNYNLMLAFQLLIFLLNTYNASPSK